MENTTFTTHKQVVEYIWSIDKTLQNHIFYINTDLYRKYSSHSNGIPELIKFCKDYNLSLGYVLHKNRHPVKMNYYNPDSDDEYIDLEDDFEYIEDDFEYIDDDTTPLLNGYKTWSNAL